MTTMDLTRRETLLRFLFGAGGIGLRALATGLPVSFLMNPRKAAAQSLCTSPSKAQYIIFNTSGAGDPIGTSAPGTFEDANIIHPPASALPTGTLTLGGSQYTAAQAWCQLPQAVLDVTQFWHIMTNTPVHPKEPYVLELMGVSPGNEMLPSLLAKATAPCLNTLQTQPVALGAVPLSFNGQALPLIPPNALQDTLGNPKGPLTQLQSIRDQTMVQIYDFYKNGATPSQQLYIDQMVTSQTQIRELSQMLIGLLATITQNTPATQIQAAIALIRMNVAPVIAVTIPFGGDNHSDPNLSNEASETISGVANIASMMTQLQNAQLQDKVSFVSLNVFGRTMATNAGGSAANGRGHNPNLQTSVVIGQPFVGGVIGSIAPVGTDFGCTAIDSTSGAGSPSGDIAPVATLGAFAQTLLAAVGGDPTQIETGAVVTGALS
jgi:hypothetical protein